MTHITRTIIIAAFAVTAFTGCDSGPGIPNVEIGDAATLDSPAEEFVTIPAIVQDAGGPVEELSR